MTPQSSATRTNRILSKLIRFQTGTYALQTTRWAPRAQDPALPRTAFPNPYRSV